MPPCPKCGRIFDVEVRVCTSSSCDFLLRPRSFEREALAPTRDIDVIRRNLRGLQGFWAEIPVARFEKWISISFYERIDCLSKYGTLRLSGIQEGVGFPRNWIVNKIEINLVNGVFHFVDQSVIDISFENASMPVTHRTRSIK